MNEESALYLLSNRVLELTDYIVEICNIIYHQEATKHQDFWLAKMIDANIYVLEEEE